MLQTKAPRITIRDLTEFVEADSPYHDVHTRQVVKDLRRGLKQYLEHAPGSRDAKVTQIVRFICSGKLDQRSYVGQRFWWTA